MFWILIKSKFFNSVALIQWLQFSDLYVIFMQLSSDLLILIADPTITLES